MRPPRMSIATLMVLVAVVAADLVIARALLALNRYLLIGAAPAVLALQLGIIRVIRRRGRSRMFWAGFLACGSVATTSFVWGMVSAPVSRAAVAPRPGVFVVRHEAPGSAMWPLWHRYFELAVRACDPLPYSREFLGVGGEMPAATLAAMCSLPQFILAVAGGMLVGSL